MAVEGLVVTGRFGEYLEELRETWPPRPELYEKHVSPVAQRDEPSFSVPTRT